MTHIKKKQVCKKCYMIQSKWTSKCMRCPNEDFYNCDEVKN